MLGAYRVLLRPPGTARLIVSLLIGRIPIGIFSLAIVLLVRAETGSFAQAGAASAAWAIGAGVLAPVQGRLVDRFGQPAVLIPSTLANALAVIGVVVCARSHSPTWALCFFAFVGGAGLPPLGACMRSVWAQVFEHDTDARTTAYTFEGIVAEAFFIVGPVITTVLIAVSSTSVALIAAVVLSLTGTIWFATAPLARSWKSSEPHERTRAGAMGSPGMRTLMLALVPTGISFGALEVAMPAFAAEHGAEAEFAGVLLSIMAAGSVVGGVWYGARQWTTPVVERFIVLHVLLAVGTLPLLLATSIPVMAVMAAIAGLALAPSAAAGYLLIDHVAPPGTTTEATTWMMTSNVAGAAAGAALAGVIVEASSARWGIALACAGPVIGAIVSVTLRRTLLPAPGSVAATEAEASAARPAAAEAVER
ncbi:MFS transporter [Conexibacter sp. JD483]|uniref:MFS transporter n=1 Tax=unclassified Conexibacter TaxID=2627773 RepID=UPI00271D89DB|nr:MULTISPECIES: MFS transporter [unclassified Conexibacter]MDO8189221.1 MFS transporter [Conexibacter sp. CPCC 205706]MDO8201138.1 MFS transporter [Conexibacter sp. CPCC 205762]MDR9372059.1 MFS transporter [Conexibacter sp. JD483]